MSDVNLRHLMQAQFNAAKRWWTAANLCRMAVLGIGIISILTNVWAEWLGLLAAALTIGHSLLLWNSDALRDTAEGLLRKIEMQDGLGWTITAREIADLLLSVPASVKAQAYTSGSGSYFASDVAQSPRRVLENLQESIWFTRHQSWRMKQYVLMFSVIVAGIAFGVLAVAWQGYVSQSAGVNLAKMTITVIVFLFSAGYVRLAASYATFAQKAQRLEDQAAHLLDAGEVSEVQAAKLLHDYQIVRAKSPLLPTWLWRRMEDELNTLWKQTKASAG